MYPLKMFNSKEKLTEVNWSSSNKSKAFSYNCMFKNDCKEGEEITDQGRGREAAHLLERLAYRRIQINRFLMTPCHTYNSNKYPSKRYLKIKAEKY